MGDYRPAKSLRCLVLGHRFFHKDFTGATTWPGYCIRCGRGPEPPGGAEVDRPERLSREEIEALLETHAETNAVLAARVSARAKLRAWLGQQGDV